MSNRFPNNPLESGNFGDEFDASDTVAILDRMRRNFELMEGSIDQEDASFQDRVVVANGTTVTVTITPDSNEKWLLFEGITIDPALADIDFNISNGEESTDSATLSSSIPKVVQDRIKAEITNNTGSQKDMDIDMSAREISKFEDGDN